MAKSSSKEPQKLKGKEKALAVKAEPEATTLAIVSDKFAELQTKLSEDTNKSLERLIKKFSTQKRGLNAGSTDSEASLRPQIIKINQPMTSTAPSGLKIGELFTDSNAPIGKEFKFIAFNFWQERLKWPEGSTISDNPECKSTDGISGLWERREWRACGPCPYRHWDATGGPNGNGGFPCKTSMNVLCLDENLTDFYRIQFQGSNAKIGKKFYNMMRRRREVFDAVWSISTEKQKGNASFMYITPELSRDLSDSDELFVLGDYVMDLVEEARLAREQAQQQYRESAQVLAGDTGRLTELIDSQGDDSAAPDLNM